MPELPEVETIRRQLSRVLPGRIIKSVDVRLPKQVRGVTLKEFKRKITGAKIVGIERRAKMLIMAIEKSSNREIKVKQRIGFPRKSALNPRSSAYLVFHLKMTGQLIYQGKDEKRKIENLVGVGLSSAKAAAGKHPKLYGGGHPIKGALEHLPNKYSHVIFQFNDGSRLFFNDLRQFGWVTLVNSYEVIESLSKTRLGPEPLSESFKLKNFVECLKKRPNARIYQAIMDQTCVVGVGNIYANESLFYARIKPTRKIADIKQDEFKRLYQGIIKILKKSVAERGTTMSDYMDALGDFGDYSRHLKVYQKHGQACLRKQTNGKQVCAGIVRRLKINTRSAFYCDGCQK